MIKRDQNLEEGLEKNTEKPVKKTATKKTKKDEGEKNILNPFEELRENDFSSNLLRPSKLDDYIGQDKMIKQLKIILRSAQIRQTLPEHMLFYGQPGLGKTTISSLIAGELGVELKIVSAPSLKKIGDAINLLVNIEKPTILFIDEIHRLRTEVEETLYTAMEDKKIDIMIGKGQGVSTLRMDLQPFTLIGATTQFGKISKPLRDRFPATFKMEAYDENQMLKIIDRNIALLNLELEEETKILVCNRSRGVPRVANNILKRFLDLHVVANEAGEKYLIKKDEALAFLEEMGILEKGLTQADVIYLKALQENSRSLKSLSGILAEETDTIEYAIEPYLIHIGFIDKDSSGRKLTAKGREYLNQNLV